MTEDEREMIVFEWVSEVLLSFFIEQEVVNSDVELPVAIRGLLSDLKQTEK